MMFSLVVTACLTMYPDVCRDFTIAQLQSEQASAHSCMMSGQVTALDWINKNPGWELVKYKCVW